MMKMNLLGMYKTFRYSRFYWVEKEKLAKLKEEEKIKAEKN